MTILRTILAALLLLLLSLVPSLVLGDSPLPASGQRKCWSSAGVRIGCAGTGQDGESRAGLAMKLRDNSDGTIADLNTGLVWEKLSRDGGIHDRGTLRTWDEALAKIDALNTPPCFAGHCSWRLPNAKELQSTVDFDRHGLAISKLFLKSCNAGCDVLSCSCSPAPGSAFGFWSSTTNAEQPSEAWQLHHGTGATVPVAKSGSGFTRAVAEPTCTKAFLTATLTFAPGGPDPVSGATVDVDYPEDRATIPGFGPSVSGITNLTGIAGGIFSAGDDDDVVSVGLVSLGQPIPPGAFAEIELDCTAETRAPFKTDFACVPNVSSFLGATVPSACSLAVRYE